MGFDKEIDNIFNCYRLIQEQQMFNPWPNEAIPSGDDTRNYRSTTGWIGGGTKPIDYSQLFQKYVGNDFNNLPPEEQNKRLGQLVDDFAKQADLSSTWSDDVKKMSIGKFIPSAAANAIRSNFDYHNQQMKDYESMTPAQREEYTKKSETFWQNKNKLNQLETNVGNLNKQEQQLKDKIESERQSGKTSQELQSSRLELLKLGDERRKLEKELNSLKPNTKLSTGTSAQPSSVPNASSQPQGLKPQGSSTGTSAQPSSVPSSSLQPQGSSTGLTSQLAKAADVAYSLNPTTAAPYAVGKALYNAGPDYAKAAYQSMANDPAIKPIANLNTPNIAGRALSNTAQAVYNSPQMTPVRNVVDGARNAYDAYSNYASNKNAASQPEFVEGDGNPPRGTRASTEREREIALANAREAQRKMNAQTSQTQGPAQSQQVSSQKPQPPVQPPQPQRQQPVQPQQTQRQTVYGTNIDPTIPNARRVTPTSTQQTAQPQQPVQSQPSTSTRQTSYTSQYLPTDEEERLRQRYYRTPSSGYGASKYY